MLKRFKSEDGQTAVEASFVVPVVIMVIFILMYLGFMLYQETLITVVANETAQTISQVYSTPEKDPFIGYAEPVGLSKTKLYRGIRQTFGKIVGASDTVDGKNQVKADWFARYRLISKRLFMESEGFVVDVAFERRDGSVLQRDVVVTIKVTYELPFLRFFGIQNTKKQFVGVGRAQCLDLLDYVSVISLINNVTNDTLNQAAGEANDIVDKVCQAINTYAENIFKKSVEETGGAQ